MNYKFRGKNHPERMGRQAQPGEEAFPMWFATDEGGQVTVELGRADFVNIAACVIRGLRDDPALAKEAMAAANEVEKTDFLELDTREKR